MGKCVYSFSSISALIKGDYYPNFTSKQILNKGNFGLGTFEGLNGELILIKDNVYQLVDNTNITLCDDQAKIPFACVCEFNYKDFELKFKNTNKKELEEKLLSLIDSKNHVQAFYAKVNFKKIYSRTVRKQEKPYKEMTEIINSQSELDIENIDAELVGFYTPSIFSKIGVEGFHWHYLSTDKKYGGHVFDMEINEIELVINSYNNLTYFSPDSDHFKNMNLDDDSIKESIEKVEKK